MNFPSPEGALTPGQEAVLGVQSIDNGGALNVSTDLNVKNGTNDRAINVGTDVHFTKGDVSYLQGDTSAKKVYYDKDNTSGGVDTTDDNEIMNAGGLEVGATSIGHTDHPGTATEDAQIILGYDGRVISRLPIDGVITNTAATDFIQNNQSGRINFVLSDTIQANDEKPITSNAVHDALANVSGGAVVATELANGESFTVENGEFVSITIGQVTSLYYNNSTAVTRNGPSTLQQTKNTFDADSGLTEILVDTDLDAYQIDLGLTLDTDDNIVFDETDIVLQNDSEIHFHGVDGTLEAHIDYDHSNTTLDITPASGNHFAINVAGAGRAYVGATGVVNNEIVTKGEITPEATLPTIGFASMLVDAGAGSGDTPNWVAFKPLLTGLDTGGNEELQNFAVEEASDDAQDHVTSKAWQESKFAPIGTTGGSTVQVNNTGFDTVNFRTDVTGDTANVRGVTFVADGSGVVTGSVNTQGLGTGGGGFSPAGDNIDGRVLTATGGTGYQWEAAPDPTPSITESGSEVFVSSHLNIGTEAPVTAGQRLNGVRFIGEDDANVNTNWGVLSTTVIDIDTDAERATMVFDVANGGTAGTNSATAAMLLEGGTDNTTNNLVVRGTINDVNLTDLNTAVGLNTDKDGITPAQATAITDNTTARHAAVVYNESGSGNAITELDFNATTQTFTATKGTVSGGGGANVSLSGDTLTVNNTDHPLITTAQTADITANTAVRGVASTIDFENQTVNRKKWKGTEAQYNAIVTKASDTDYYIDDDFTQANFSLVSINTAGDTIRIDAVPNQIPVVTGGSVSGTTLTLNKNGADDITITGLPSGGSGNFDPAVPQDITADWTFSGGRLTLSSSDAGDTDGPDLDLFRDSASPATGDELAAFRSQGRDDQGEVVNYVAQWTEIQNPVDGDTHAGWYLDVADGGTAGTRREDAQLRITSDANNGVEVGIRGDLVVAAEDTPYQETTATWTGAVFSNTTLGATNWSVLSASSEAIFFPFADVPSGLENALYRPNSSATNYYPISFTMTKGANTIECIDPSLRTHDGNNFDFEDDDGQTRIRLTMDYDNNTPFITSIVNFLDVNAPSITDNEMTFSLTYANYDPALITRIRGERLNLSTAPTSNAGLAAGDVYSQTGTQLGLTGAAASLKFLIIN